MREISLDRLRTLVEITDLGSFAEAARVLHLAPPPSQDMADWRIDPRTRALVHALAQRTPPLALVYGSTTGVYGDHGGGLVTEDTPLTPATARGRARVLRPWRQRCRSAMP